MTKKNKTFEKATVESLFTKLDKAKELIEEAREGFEKRKFDIVGESFSDELTELENLMELIKKSILAKVFRGDLETNCEDDERALELLKESLSKN